MIFVAASMVFVEDYSCHSQYDHEDDYQLYCMHVFMCMNGTLPIHGYIMHDHLYKVNGSLSILGGPYFGQKYSMSEPYMLDMYGLQVHVCPILDIVV